MGQKEGKMGKKEGEIAAMGKMEKKLPQKREERVNFCHFLAQSTLFTQLRVLIVQTRES